MKTIDQIIAENLQEIMDQRDLTQARLAELADISIGSVQNILYRRHWPRIEQLEIICRALGVDPIELFQLKTPLKEQQEAVIKQRVFAAVANALGLKISSPKESAVPASQAPPQGEGSTPSTLGAMPEYQESLRILSTLDQNQLHDVVQLIRPFGKVNGKRVNNGKRNNHGS